MNEDELLIRCNCHDHEHHMFLYYDEDIDMFYLNVHLSRGNFLWRLKHLWTYLFAPRLNTGCYDEFVLSRSTANSLAEFIMGD